MFLSKSGDDKTRAQKAFSDPSAAHCSGVTTGPCADGRSALNAMHSDNDTGVGMLIVGGGLVVGAVVTYLLWPTAASPRAALAPYVDGRGAGVSASGNF